MCRCWCWTAFGGLRDAVAAMKERADDYLVKPVDLDELMVKVERALGPSGADPGGWSTRASASSARTRTSRWSGTSDAMIAFPGPGRAHPAARRSGGGRVRRRC